MGVRYEWVDDSHIIMNLYLEFPWTWTEYQAVVDKVMPMLKDLGHPTSTAVDVTRMGALPRDGHFLQILMGVEKAMPDNLFASVVIGAPYGVMIFMNMLMKLRPRAKRLALFAPTMEDAHAKIRARYQELYSKSGKSV